MQSDKTQAQFVAEAAARKKEREMIENPSQPRVGILSSAGTFKGAWSSLEENIGKNLPKLRKKTHSNSVKFQAATFNASYLGDVARLKLEKDHKFLTILFIICTTALCVAELVLISQAVVSNSTASNSTTPVTGDGTGGLGYFNIKNSSPTFHAQVFVLGISTIFYFIELIATFCYIEIPLNSVKPVKWRTLFKMYHVISFEVALQTFFLAVGWSTILYRPSLAAIRAFRSFRQLWYVELFAVKQPKEFIPKDHSFSLLRASQICMVYIQNILEEIFTAKSRGGLVVVFLFASVTYVLAITFQNEFVDLVVDGIQPCINITSCYITLMRLAFYDGLGFDFFTAVATSGNNYGLTIILVMYVLVTAIILFNGLIAVFGQSFQLPDQLTDKSTSPTTLANSKDQKASIEVVSIDGPTAEEKEVEDPEDICRNLALINLATYLEMVKLHGWSEVNDQVALQILKEEIKKLEE